MPARSWRSTSSATAHHYVFHKDLRRSVIFGRHDLVQDAPISRIDLLVCRNTLMYLNSETQARILAGFHFALNRGGFLFLGKAEMLLTHSHLFSPVDLKRRVFAKVPRPRREARTAARRGDRERGDPPHGERRRASATLAFEADPVAQMVVDPGGVVTMVNERARALFGLDRRRPRAPAPRPAGLVPAGRPALGDRGGD